MLMDENFERIDLIRPRQMDDNFVLGESRSLTRAGGDQFHAAGIDGSYVLSGRQGYMYIGVAESQMLEDEACAWKEGANCSGTNRLQWKYTCPAGTCSSNIANLSDNEMDDSTTQHATAVMSIAAADYTEDQGCGQSLGDPAWGGGASCHAPAWEDDATGMAPKSRLIFAGGIRCANCDELAGGAAILAKLRDFDPLYSDLGGKPVDIANASFDSGQFDNETCLIDSNLPLAHEAENLFDDGVLVVAAAGNENGGSLGGSCNMDPPASVIKTLAVNGYKSNSLLHSDCNADINDCKVDEQFAATGGANAIINGSMQNGVITGVDVIAPGWIHFQTEGPGVVGDVRESELQSFVGTSGSTPIVSGLAALVKQWLLVNGHTFILDPGYLHSMMLLMTDRHFSTNPSSSMVATTQKMSEADKFYGLGRVRVRKMMPNDPGGPWGWWVHRTTFFSTSTTPENNVAFVNLPSGVEMVKCVALQAEDMSSLSKTEISNVDLRLDVKTTGVTGCASANAPAIFTRSDTSLDAKSMVAITEDDDGVTLDGKCVRAVVTPTHITSAGIQVFVSCAFSGISDDDDTPP